MQAVPLVASLAYVIIIIIIIISIIIIYILCARGVALVNTKPFLHLVSSYGELELGGGNTAQSLTDHHTRAVSVYAMLWWFQGLLPPSLL